MLGSLLVAVVAAGVFILLPLLFRRDAPGGGSHAEPLIGRLWPFVYFAGLGLGFLWVEIPLLQRFILYLDQPTYAFATVLFGVLVWSGVGSLASDRVRVSMSTVVLAVAVLSVIYAIGLPSLFDATLGLPFAGRLVLSVALLAPLGVAMGVPFPRAIRTLGGQAPALVPWAWAVNGSTSVVSAILATVLALSFGFTWVILGGAAAYLAAASAAYVWQRRGTPASCGAAPTLTLSLAGRGDFDDWLKRRTFDKGLEPRGGVLRTISGEGDEPDGALVEPDVLVAPAFDEPERLHGAGRADRDDHPAIVGELPEQRRGHVVRRGGHDDGVEWPFLLPAEVPVRLPELYVTVAEPVQPVCYLPGQRRNDLDAVDAVGDLGQDRPWYPDPVPISSTRSPGSRSNRSVIQATTKGCEMVCPALMGSAISRYARPLSPGSTNSSRRTVLIAWKTSGSVISTASA